MCRPFYLLRLKMHQDSIILNQNLKHIFSNKPTFSSAFLFLTMYVTCVYL